MLYSIITMQVPVHGPIKVAHDVKTVSTMCVLAHG